MRDPVNLLRPLLEFVYCPFKLTEGIWFRDRGQGILSNENQTTREQSSNAPWKGLNWIWMT